jgi:hypothetical protein
MSTLNFPENLDLILIVEATLLVRVRAPPETWTTKLEPFGAITKAFYFASNHR